MTTAYASDKDERLKSNVAELRRQIAAHKEDPEYERKEVLKQVVRGLEAICDRFEFSLNFKNRN